MTQYFVDLGFDWNANQMLDMNGNPLTQNGQPLYELQWGLVNMTGNTSMASMDDFQNGDTVLFNIYDVTAQDGQRSGNSGASPQLPNPWMHCNAGDEGTPAGCGFTNISTLNSGGSVGSQESGASTYFGSPSGAVWPIMVSTNPALANVAYPSNFTGDATYQLTWQITVNNGNASKTYIVDPEMIVKPTGGG